MELCKGTTGVLEGADIPGEKVSEVNHQGISLTLLYRE